MRVVENDDVATFAGNDAGFRGREPVAAGCVIEPGFLILVRQQPITVAPEPLVLWRLDNAATLDTVARRQATLVAEMHEFHAGTAPTAFPELVRIRRIVVRIGILRPYPGREEHICAQRFHVPRRHIDQQATFDFPIGDRFEMVANGLDVPVALKRLRLDHGPERLRKVEQ